MLEFFKVLKNGLSDDTAEILAAIVVFSVLFGGLCVGLYIDSI